MNTDHVFAPKCDVSCFNCGALVELRPMPVAALADAVRGFLLMHRRCEKPVEPSPQMELPIICVRCHGQVTAGEADRHFSECRAGIDASTDEPAPEIDPPGPALPGRASDMLRELRDDDNEVGPCGLCGKVGPREFYETGLMMVCSGGCTETVEEHDKPELTEGDLPDHYAKFAEMYPMASDPVKLTEQVHRALGNTDAYPHLFDYVAKWHPSSVAFQLIAAWARIECAHMDSEARGLTSPIPGLTIPAVLPMPKSLQEAPRAMNGGKEPKKKRVRSAPTERARKKEQAPDAG